MGIVKEDYQYFKSMNDYDYLCIEPIIQHFTCMIDLLCCANYLDEAKNFINNMP